MSKYHFKEGDEVRHKYNLEKLLVVCRILKDSKEIISGYDANNEPLKKSVVRMIGVECHFWEYDKELGEKVFRKEKFHSRELIPEFIVEKGKEAIEEWLNETD